MTKNRPTQRKIKSLAALLWLVTLKTKLPIQLTEQLTIKSKLVDLPYTYYTSS